MGGDRFFGDFFGGLVGNQGRFRANSNAYGCTVMTGWTSTKVHRDKVIFLSTNQLNDLSCGVTLFDIRENPGAAIYLTGVWMS